MINYCIENQTLSSVLHSLFSNSITDPLSKTVTGPPEGLDERHRGDPDKDHEDGHAWVILPVKDGIDKLGWISNTLPHLTHLVFNISCC